MHTCTRVFGHTCAKACVCDQFGGINSLSVMWVPGLYFRLSLFLDDLTNPCYLVLIFEVQNV